MCKLSLLKIRSFAIKLLSAFLVSKPENLILGSSNLFVARALETSAERCTLL